MTAKTHLQRIKPRSTRTTGVLVLLFLAVFSLFAFNRPRVETTLTPGEGLKAEFAAAHKLVPYQSVVKLAGVQVGTVTGVERTPSNGAVVEMKLDDGTVKKLGTEPGANLRPTLVLGGMYYVELVRGGGDGGVREDGTIPVARTTVPVELDKVLSTLTPTTDAIKGTVADLDKTFQEPGRREVQRFLTQAPGTLKGTSEVLGAARGTSPQHDLTHLVTGLRNTSAALTEREGRLASIIDDLHTTSSTLAASGRPLARAVADGPATLEATRTGLADLDPTLDKLQKTAGSFRPAARELEPLLAELDTVLGTARPVIADARLVARDARPLVQRLVPAAQDLGTVFDDIRGPVLDRLTGPVSTTVNSSWHGTGVYEGGGNDHLLYEELAYFFSDTADVFKFHDKNGAMGRLMAGVGINSPGGVVSKGLVQYLEGMGLLLPAGPEEGANVGEATPPLGSSPSSAVSPERTPLGIPGLPALQLPLVSRSAP